jgi:hypothetical protein
MRPRRRSIATKEALCRVNVFLLSVDHQLDDWPEKAQRKRGWVTREPAAWSVDEGGLVEVIRAAFPAIRFPSLEAGRQEHLPH